MGGPSLWGASRSSHNFGIPFLGSCTDKKNPSPARKFTETDRQKKAGLYS